MCCIAQCFMMYEPMAMRVDHAKKHARQTLLKNAPIIITGHAKECTHKGGPVARRVTKLYKGLVSYIVYTMHNTSCMATLFSHSYQNMYETRPKHR